MRIDFGHLFHFYGPVMQLKSLRTPSNERQTNSMLRFFFPQHQIVTNLDIFLLWKKLNYIYLLKIASRLPAHRYLIARNKNENYDNFDFILFGSFFVIRNFVFTFKYTSPLSFVTETGSIDIFLVNVDCCFFHGDRFLYPNMGI